MKQSKANGVRVKNSIALKYPYFINEVISKDSMNMRVFTKASSIFTIIKILDPLITGEYHASELFRKSTIGLKRSFYHYIRICLNFGFIIKDRDAGAGGGKRVHYSITEKGKILLDLFNIES